MPGDPRMTAPMGRIQLRGCKRLLSAAACIRSVGGADSAEYRGFCLSLPALLRKGGLAETLAYLETKEVGRKLAADLAEVIGINGLLGAAMTESDTDRYLDLSADVLEVAELFALAAWKPEESEASPEVAP